MVINLAHSLRVQGHNTLPQNFTILLVVLDVWVSSAVKGGDLEDLGTDFSHQSENTLHFRSPSNDVQLWLSPNSLGLDRVPRRDQTVPQEQCARTLIQERRLMGVTDMISNETKVVMKHHLLSRR